MSIYGQGNLDKSIVLGRNQTKRVDAAAKYLKAYGFDVKTITDDIIGGPRTVLENRTWMHNALQHGYSIIDLGLGPEFTKGGNF